MPTHPPDDLTEVRDVTLWRDLTRMFEDYCGNDEAVWPERRLDFSRITRRVIEPIIPDWDAHYIQRLKDPAYVEPHEKYRMSGDRDFTS